MSLIVTFTDFGLHGPYLGQMKAVLYQQAPGVSVVDLFADAPAQRVRESAYLLAAYAMEFPPGTVFLCVVDPGVGGEREPVVMQADGRLFVGPGNGLFELLRRRASTVRQWRIDSNPVRLSASFHGRDLFAPAAAAIASGALNPGVSRELTAPIEVEAGREWPDELQTVCYIDHYGNLISGVRAKPDLSLAVSGQLLPRRNTFSDVAIGEVFCYENSSGLLEVAVNQGRASEVLGLGIGDELSVVTLPDG